MRFDEVAARLATLPDPLPTPLDALIPVRLDGVRWRSPSPTTEIPGRPAAVLVLLYPDSVGDTRVVLIERPTVDGHHHSGEVSFPGGKAEPEDDDAIVTALREAGEEVCLDPDAAGVRVVGLLDRFWIPVSDYAVTPVVALAGSRPDLVAAPAEVVRILEPPLARFLPGAPVAMVERTIRGWPLRYGHYEIDGLSVWGATARVLSQLGAVLGRADDATVSADTGPSHREP
ncbi:MAG TPA: CoA pyrophosphatase [Candidatus Limnocylindrales bacterium]|jgi:8-oxo-dGTP pyrophosphatase MutT (NUDIX family)|nr:CoA pyrophosphatase [Candidatus Limnocylindrales bacterium]